jgi:hypothetical protein
MMREIDAASLVEAAHDASKLAGMRSANRVFLQSR